MRKSEDEHGIAFLQCGKNILIGGIAALVFSFGFLLLAVFGISMGFWEGELRYQLAVVACVLGSFFGGALAVRSCSEHSLLAGILTGAVLFLLQLTIGVLTYDSFQLDERAFGLLFGGLCGGAAAGILTRKGKRKNGGRSKKKKKH